MLVPETVTLTKFELTVHELLVTLTLKFVVVLIAFATYVELVAPEIFAQPLVGVDDCH